MRVRRSIYGSDHSDFRDTVRAFLAREAVPHYADWERDGLIPREVYRRAGESGLIGMAVPEEYGGAGVADFRFSMVLIEECARAAVPALNMFLSGTNDLCIPYLLSHGTEEQKRRWLPPIVSGEQVIALALTEPAAGSDLAAIATTALPEAGGYRVSGAKTFISNGLHCDVAITAVKTDRAAGRKGISLLLIEAGAPGFSRGRRLEKIGLHAQDTAELFFDDMFVPAGNLLGSEGGGFAAMMHNLAVERMSIAVLAVASARAALDGTLDYVRTRTAFGKPIGSFQSSRFALAEMQTEVDVTQAFVDQCCRALDDGTLTGEDAAEAKWWSTEVQGRVIDRCVQLHGGYGYMLEYPIARAYVDARVTRIYGGTNEIMKEIIGRSLGLR